MKNILVLTSFLLVLLSCKNNQIKFALDQDIVAKIPQIISPPEELLNKENLSLVINGKSIAVQRSLTNKFWLVADTFIPKKTEAYFDISTTNFNPAPIILSENRSDLIANFNGEEIMSYAIATRMPPDTVPSYFQRSGFIDPLKTKSGQVITAGFPEGHVHQHGLFNAWRSTHFRDQFVDFWNQADELGTVVHKEVLQIANGPVFSEFKVALQQIATIEEDTVPALDETWHLKLFALSDHWVLDWSIEQQCAGKDNLYLDEYHYGGAAFRGCETWNVHGGAYDSLVYFITNEGKTEVNGNHSRPKWVAMYGETGIGVGGVAMMGNRNNFRHPQPIRIHPTMPYFVYTPSVLGDFSIASGDVYSSDYRLLIYDGPPPEKLIELLAEKF